MDEVRSTNARPPVRPAIPFGFQSAGQRGPGPWRRLLIAAAVPLVVAAAIAGGLALRSSRAGATEPVALIRWNEQGERPFWETTATPNLGPRHRSVGEIARRGEAVAPPSGGAATIHLRGTQAGVFVGSRRQVCDVDQLKQLLADDAGTRAAVFGQLAGTAPDTLGAWIDGLTPVLLSADTWFTSHGFSDGRATPVQAVFQAGTAVLVDRTGQPRVRCAGANPLGPAHADGVTLAVTRGAQWDGYDPGRVVTIEPGAPVEALDLVDVSSGEEFRRPVGAGAGWVVATNDPDGGGRVTASGDGQTWETVFSTSEALTAVAHGDGRWLAVGATTVFASADRRTWQPVGPAPGEVADLAYGDGRWLAVGGRPAGEGPGAAAWESRDGVTWTVLDITAPGSAESTGTSETSFAAVGFGRGRWVVAESGGDSVQVSTSADGRRWQRTGAIEGRGRPLRLGFGGGRWALVGPGFSAISTDGQNWTTSPLDPADARLAGPVFTGSRWYGVLAGSRRATVPLLVSEDGVHWTPLAEIPLPEGEVTVADLAYGGGPVPAPTSGGPRPTPGPSPTPSGPAMTSDEPTGGGGTDARITGDPVSRRASPRRNGAATGSLPRGARIRIVCQVVGDVVGPGRGTPVWNRLGDGDYVSDAYTDAPKISPPAINPAIGACPS